MGGGGAWEREGRKGGNTLHVYRSGYQQEERTNVSISSYALVGFYSESCLPISIVYWSMWHRNNNNKAMREYLEYEYTKKNMHICLEQPWWYRQEEVSSLKENKFD